MARFARTLILVLIVSFPPTCVAMAQPEAVAMEREGHAGVWLPLDQAREALAALTTAPALEAQIRALEAQLRVREAQLDRYREANVLADRTRVLLEEAVDEAIAARESALAWWRHPLLWGTVGVVAGIVAAVLVP